LHRDERLARFRHHPANRIRDHGLDLRAGTQIACRGALFAAATRARLKQGQGETKKRILVLKY
jgi:hypothetical protein